MFSSREQIKIHKVSNSLKERGREKKHQSNNEEKEKATVIILSVQILTFSVKIRHFKPLIELCLSLDAVQVMLSDVERRDNV